MQPLQLQVTEIGDREFYPSFLEKEKITRTQVWTVDWIPPETLLFCVHDGLKHCCGGEGFHASLSLVIDDFG